VRNSDGDRVRGAGVTPTGILTGSGQRVLDVWDPSASEGTSPGRIDMAYTDKKGRYKIPFMWDKTGIGTWGTRKRFRTFAISDWKTRPASSGSDSGWLYICVSTQPIMKDILPGLDRDDLAAMKWFDLPGAFKTILTPRLSVPDMIGFGYCNIWLGTKT